MSCRKASSYVSKSLDTPLKIWEKASMYFHLAMCKACRENYRQLHHIHEVIRADSFDLSHGESGLSQEARDRIKIKLQTL